MEPKLQKTSRWHIDKGVVGKHHGLSYCEGCDYVPPHKTIFNSIYLEYERGPQILSQYCLLEHLLGLNYHQQTYARY